LKPTEGVIHINGENIRKNPMNALQNSGTILEVPEFYPYLSPRETMIYLGKIRGMKQQYLDRRIKEVMEEVEMSEWVDEKIGKFSTGMKQRTAIAQAMLHEPSLLILDEPTNGLDPKGMAHIRDVINILKKERTIFLSSHLLNEVELICDTVILINKGRVLAFDSLTKIQHMLKATQIKVNFLEPIDDLTLKKIGDLNEVQNLLRDNNSLMLSYDGSKKSAATILNSLIKDLNLKVAAFHPLEKGLEDFYIDLIEQDNLQKGGKNLAF